MDKYNTLTILHSNDLHGDFHSERKPEEPDILHGGVSLLSGYINKVRGEEKNVIYTISGDMFSGSVIDSEYRGMSTTQLLNILSPDVVSLGNHEMDYGLAHLLLIEKFAFFPIICSNMYLRNGTRLFKSHYIKKIDGMRILFIGVLTPEALLCAQKDEMISSLLDIRDAAHEVAKICRRCDNEDIDLTVLLTHIGANADAALAAELDPSLDVDLIIGGHSHTFMEKPLIINGIPIVQAYMGTSYIGRFDLVVDTEENRLAEWKWESVPIDSLHSSRDAELDKLLGEYEERVSTKYNKVLSTVTPVLTHPTRYAQTELGSFISDIFREYLDVDIALIGSGSLRLPSFGPEVTVGDIKNLHPFDEEIHIMSIDGETLFEMLLRVYSRKNLDDRGEFYQLSKGLYVECYPDAPARTKILFNEKPIELEKEYKVAVQGFSFINFDIIFGIDRERFREYIFPFPSQQIIENYLKTHIEINYCSEKRIVIVNGCD